MAAVQDEVQRRLGAPGIRWVREDARHLTLKFLANIPVSRVAAVEQAMNEAVAGKKWFTLSLATLGVFLNPRRPRVLWVGLGGETDRLQTLYGSLEERLAAARFPREDRPFSPHLTLGRVSDGISRGIEQRLKSMLAEWDTNAIGPTFTAERLVLYKSTLTPQGAIYDELASATLST